MNAGFHADAGILEEITGTLRDATDDLRRTRAAAPEEPDAGDATAAVGAILTELVGEADQLAATTADAGDAVADSAARYAAEDEQAEEDIADAGGQ